MVLDEKVGFVKLGNCTRRRWLLGGWYNAGQSDTQSEQKVTPSIRRQLLISTNNPQAHRKSAPSRGRVTFAETNSRINVGLQNTAPLTLFHRCGWGCHWRHAAGGGPGQSACPPSMQTKHSSAPQCRTESAAQVSWINSSLHVRRFWQLVRAGRVASRPVETAWGANENVLRKP